MTRFAQGGQTSPRQRGWDAAEVSVLEPVAVAFQADHLGVMNQSETRRFIQSWLSAMPNPRVMAVLVLGVGRVHTGYLERRSGWAA